MVNLLVTSLEAAYGNFLGTVMILEFDISSIYCYFYAFNYAYRFIGLFNII